MARRIVTPAQRALRDRFKLEGWVAKHEERRRAYFGWCDQARDRLTSIGGGEEPGDASVVDAIRLALQADNSFTTHVMKKDADFLVEEANWEKIYAAGSATVFHEYLVACEKGTWPES